MSKRSLEISSYNGRLMAAYLSFGLTGHAGIRTKELEPDLVVDLASDGTPLGLEIISPSVVTLESINRALASVGQAPATDRELSPLFAARGIAAVAAPG